jgi:hypothetical protein
LSIVVTIFSVAELRATPAWGASIDLGPFKLGNRRPGVNASFQYCPSFQFNRWWQIRQ